MAAMNMTGQRLKAVFSMFNEGNRVQPGGILKTFLIVLSVFLSLFELYISTFGEMNTLVLSAIFLTTMYTIAFVTTTYHRASNNILPVDYIMSAISLAIGIYYYLNAERFTQWVTGISEFTTIDFIAGLLLFLFTLELMRRAAGIGISLVVLALLLYTFFGHLLSGTFEHREIPFKLFIERMFISLEGLFSEPVEVAATYAFLFVMFGKFFHHAGGGQFFFNLSALIAGRRIGGPAKVAVISSGLFGMVSGSPTSDVVTTGSVTIPMMNKMGYQPAFAGGVEAVASTGGSILPPVMGSAVFLMVEFTQIPYADIMKSAVFIALLYYFVVYQQVHFRSIREGLTGMSKDQIAGIKTTFLTGWQHMIPLIILVYALLDGYTPFYVAAVAIVAVFAVSWFKRETRITWNKLVDIFVDTCFSMATLAVVCAAAGIVIGCINLTGLAGKFSSLIFALTGNNLFLSLLIAMVITILLGMGMPTVSVYVLAAALVAPSLISLGVGLLEAHLFIVYYASLSAITPPVAVACYAASTIADERPMPIAIQAVRMGIVAFILPFVFVFQPSLLLIGSWPEIILSMVTAVIGAYFLAVAVEGWYKRDLSAWERIGMAAAGLFTIYPGLYTDIIGIVLGMGLLLFVFKRSRTIKNQPAVKGQNL